MHSRLEQYLEQVETRLHTVPAPQRHSEIEEMRQHMEAMVEARRELGASEEAAVEATLEQFGAARTVGKDLTHALQRGERLPGNMVTAAISTYLCLWGVGLGVMHLLFAVRRDGMHLRLLGDIPGKMQPLPVVLGAIFSGAIFVSLAAGAMTGAIFPRKATAGIVLAYLTFFALQLNTMYHISPVGLPHQLAWYLYTGGSHVCGAALSILGAKLGTRWHKDRHRRRIALQSLSCN